MSTDHSHRDLWIGSSDIVDYGVAEGEGWEGEFGYVFAGEFMVMV